jgi:hypothetical protein
MPHEHLIGVLRTRTDPFRDARWLAAKGYKAKVCNTHHQQMRLSQTLSLKPERHIQASSVRAHREASGGCTTTCEDMRCRQALQRLALAIAVVNDALPIVRCHAPITTVGNFSALRASIENGEQHIEIIQHMDLTALKISEGSRGNSVTSKFLLQPKKSTRSIRVCCDGKPDFDASRKHLFRHLSHGLMWLE